MEGLSPFIKKEDLSENLQRLADIVGYDKALEISHEFAGEYVYITSARIATRKARNRKIRKEFTGANYGELGRRYNLTSKHIRDIIHKKQKQRRP